MRHHPNRAQRVRRARRSFQPLALALSGEINLPGNSPVPRPGRNFPPPQGSKVCLPSCLQRFPVSSPAQARARAGAYTLQVRAKPGQIAQSCFWTFSLFPLPFPILPSSLSFSLSLCRFFIFCPSCRFFLFAFLFHLSFSSASPSVSSRSRPLPRARPRSLSSTLQTPETLMTARYQTSDPCRAVPGSASACITTTQPIQSNPILPVQT